LYADKLMLRLHRVVVFKMWLWFLREGI